MSVLETVKQNGYALLFIEHQTEAICLAAVKQNGLALEFVQHQTEEICLVAVKQDWGALQYVQPGYFKAAVKNLRLCALFDPEIDDYIKNIEIKMRKKELDNYINKMQNRALFEPKLDETIKSVEKKMQT